MMEAHFETPAGSEDFDLSFKVFHELMARKVTDILLISSPYEAFIMEEEGRLAERIIHEYRGLNLSRPPMLTWVSTSQEALEALRRKKFDLVITMPLVDDTDAYVLGRTIKENFPDLPVFLLVHKTGQHLIDPRASDGEAIDRVYVWQGNSDLLLALIKNLEDRMNVAFDTERAKVRVIVLVEDAPVHYSSLLPILYKEIVTQTQAAMEESVNDEHRIFRMRARPKILVAQTYEEAVDLCRRYRPYLLSVLSDVRFPRGGAMDEKAGVELLSMIRAENPDLPLLNLSTDEANREKAKRVPAVFINKTSPTLYAEIHEFFMQYLGFGDFIFRLPDGREIARASNLRDMERLLPSIPDDSVDYHAPPQPLLQLVHGPLGGHAGLEAQTRKGQRLCQRGVPHALPGPLHPRPAQRHPARDHHRDGRGPLRPGCGLHQDRARIAGRQGARAGVRLHPAQSASRAA